MSPNPWDDLAQALSEGLGETEPRPNLDEYELETDTELDNPGSARGGRPVGSKNKPKKTGPDGYDVNNCMYKKAPDHVQTVLSTIPVPFLEADGEKPYSADVSDKYMPRPGFITDFVNMGRGTECPTLFLMWGALWTLSAALNRNTWFKWYPEPLWPNLYVILVSPAGLCHKSAPINFGQKLLRIAETMHPDTSVAFKNSYRFLTSKGSPEGVYMMLKPEQKTFLGGDDAPNKIIQVKRSSKVTMAVSELATFLGKQQYNGGLVSLLTDLYDCKDNDTEITRGRGIEPIEDIYVTMLGGITPTGIEESIPPEAMSGGLISRTTLIYQDMPTKLYAEPTLIADYPAPADIGPKLAWIQANCTGEYAFTDEAREAFKMWYIQWKSEIIAGITALRDDENRKDIILRKLALLMRVQEYRPGHEITMRNFQDAKRLLDFTLSRSGLLLSDVGTSLYIKTMDKIKTYLDKRGPTTRRELLNRHAKKIRAEELTSIINQLVQQGHVTITVNDKQVLTATGSAKEVYIPMKLET